MPEKIALSIGDEFCRESGQLLMPVTGWRTVIEDNELSMKQAIILKLAHKEFQ